MGLYQSRLAMTFGSHAVGLHIFPLRITGGGSVGRNLLLCGVSPCKARDQQKADVVHQPKQYKSQREDRYFAQNDGATIILVSEWTQKQNARSITQQPRRATEHMNATMQRLTFYVSWLSSFGDTFPFSLTLRSVRGE